MKWLLVLLACYIYVAVATESLAKISHHEPVLNFVVNDARDKLSFDAYSTHWEFNIWLTDVHEGNTDHYHGKLVGNPAVIGSFSFMMEGTSGMILYKNNTLFIESRKDNSLFIYRASDVVYHPSTQKPHCGGRVIHIDGVPNHNSHMNKRYNHVTAILKDQYWADAGNNPWASDANTYSLLNDVNLVYSSAQLNTFSFEIVGVRQNSWTQNANLQDMLTDVSSYVRDGGVASKYTTVSWLVGNNVGGLAWIGSACGAYGAYYKTAVAGLANFSRLWTVKTIAHELGHNRGANHDFTNQCASGQNTNCQCSVMSYCFPDSTTYGGAVNYFSATSIGEITRTCN